MYQKDCLPLLSTFCKFQRLKVKGSQVTLVCGSNTVEHKWSGITVNKVQAVQRFSSVVPATLICVWLLKCTHGDSLEVWHITTTCLTISDPPTISDHLRPSDHSDPPTTPTTPTISDQRI